MLSKIFNMSVLKLVVALSIPAGIAFIFWWAQETARVEVGIVQEKLKQKDHTTAATIVDYELKEVDDSNRVRWQLVAKKGTVNEATQIVTLRDVKVEYYDGPHVKMRLLSPVGEANQETKYVKLYGENGQRVQAEGQDGKAKMRAATVELKEKNKFLASGGVNIEWPEVAKVKGDYATGTVDLADFKNFKVVGNTHALIYVN